MVTKPAARTGGQGGGGRRWVSITAALQEPPSHAGPLLGNSKGQKLLSFSQRFGKSSRHISEFLGVLCLLNVEQTKL